MQPLLIVGIAQGLFASIFFLARRPRKYSDIVVALFMIFLTLPLLLKMLNLFFRADGVMISALFSALPFTHGPFLFLYTWQSITEHAVPQTKQLLHFLPFMLIVIFYAAAPISLPNELSRVNPQRAVEIASSEQPDSGMYSAASRDIHDEASGGRPVNVRWVIAFILLAASYLGYTVLILLMLARHRRSIADYYSSASGTTTLLWLKWTAIAFLATGIFIGVFTTLIPSIMFFHVISPGIADVYGIVFFTFVFCLFSVKQPQLFSEIPNVKADAPRYERSGLSDEDARIFKDKIEQYMNASVPYRNSELTIVDVADAVGLSRHHLTQVLNGLMGINFYTYINSFRIKEALECMKNADDENSVLRIAYDVGFNSKSTFNRVFKQTTGMTPTEYRERTHPQKK